MGRFSVGEDATFYDEGISYEDLAAIAEEQQRPIEELAQEWADDLAPGVLDYVISGKPSGIGLEENAARAAASIANLQKADRTRGGNAITDYLTKDIDAVNDRLATISGRKPGVTAVDHVVGPPPEADYDPGPSIGESLSGITDSIGTWSDGVGDRLGTITAPRGHAARPGPGPMATPPADPGIGMTTGDPLSPYADNLLPPSLLPPSAGLPEDIPEDQGQAPRPYEKPTATKAGTGKSGPVETGDNPEVELNKLQQFARDKFGLDKDGRDALSRALIRGGGAMMMGTSPYAGQNIGAGIIAGVEGFTDAKDDQRQATKDELAAQIQQERMDMARAQEARAAQSHNMSIEDRERAIRDAEYAKKNPDPYKHLSPADRSKVAAQRLYMLGEMSEAAYNKIMGIDPVLAGL